MRQRQPVAAHIIGSPEAGVIPGMVLISLTRIFPEPYRFEGPPHRFQNMIIDRMVGIDRVPPATTTR